MYTVHCIPNTLTLPLLLLPRQYLDIGGNGVTCVSDVTGRGAMLEAAAAQQAVSHAAIAGSSSGDGGSAAGPSPSPSACVPMLLPLLCCLQVLNLSYTKNLKIDAGCFHACVNLQRLVLDGTCVCV